MNEEVIIDVTVNETGKSAADEAKDVGVLTNSIEGLSKANKQLREERKKLDITTDAGKKRIQEINKTLDQNNKVIKDNSSALEKQRLNVGNYTGALDKLIPGLGATIQGIQGATRAAWAFVANPIGAILVAIGLAVAGAVAYFKQFEWVLDIIEDVITQVSAVISSLIQNLDKVASILGNVLVGNFNEAAEATKNLGQTLGDAADEAQRLLEKTRELEDAEMKFRVANAAAVNQMKAWVVAAKNKNLSQEESNALLQKARDLENKLTEEAVKNAQERADIEEGKLVASRKAQLDAAGIARGAQESQADFINRLIDSGIFSPEMLDPLIAAYEKVEQEASAGLAFQEKIANEQAALEEKAQAAREKSQAAREKAAEKRKADQEKALAERQKAIEQQRKMDDDEYKYQVEQQKLAREKKYADFIEAQEAEDLALKERFANQQITKEEYDAMALEQEAEHLAELKEYHIQHGLEVMAIDDQIAANKIAQNDKIKAADLKLKNEQLKIANDEAKGKAAVANASLVLAKTIFGENKAIAIAETTINTINGITRAFKDYIFPYSSIVAGLVGATGFANVAKIAGVSFAAGGGDFYTKGPTMLVVGDNPGGVERVTVEPISGKGKTTVNGNLVAMAGGGTLTAMGSNIATQNAATASEGRSQARQMAEALNTVQVILVREDYEVKQMEHQQLVKRATVIG